MTRYKVYVTAAAFKETKQLPAYVRHRVMRAIGALAEDPRPPRRQALHHTELPLELRRIRLARWRLSPSSRNLMRSST